MHNQGNTYYGDYLQLSKLLDTQHPKSKEVFGEDKEAHDETLFIIVHQAYELWFKQIIHEMQSIWKIFRQKNIEEKQLSTVVHRLNRITKIQEILLDQLSVMETMTPMDFLEFRDLLIPASGFQSVQFRQIEIMMGLRTDKRFNVDRQYFLGRLQKHDQEKLLRIEEQPSLLELISDWLERTPFLSEKEFNFWQDYRAAVKEMLDNDMQMVESNPGLTAIMREAQVENLKATEKTFDSLFNESAYEKLFESGKRKLSQKAMLGALFISLYREEPILSLPYRILSLLIDIDEGFTAWRYRHALMAHRLLGTKIGTGGTSGHQYLKLAAENNRVFIDLFDISTFIIPKDKLPKLPVNLKQKLNFYHGNSNEL